MNILTIDVEDYFQVENFKEVIKFSDWDRYEIRVEQNTKKILDILEKAGIKATFFVLGWIAARCPELVKKIHQDGHEVASHGYGHQLVYTQTPDEFRADLRKAKVILEEIIREPVYGYRAPTYSITKKSLWAFDILMEEGFRYDSSIFPAQREKGGMSGAERYPYTISNHQKNLWELPISMIRVLNKNVPFSGGGYFRLLPYNFIRSAIYKINKAGFPAVIYLHPWELDAGQPRIKADYFSMFKHYVNIPKTEKKLRQLLKDFQFKPVRDYLVF